MVEASTAEEALRKFKSSTRGVGLLIADVRLPTSSGIQVALIFEQKFQTFPFSCHPGIR